MVARKHVAVGLFGFLLLLGLGAIVLGRGGPEAPAVSAASAAPSARAPANDDFAPAMLEGENRPRIEPLAPVGLGGSQARDP